MSPRKSTDDASSSSSRTRTTRSADVKQFINDMDGRALLWMYAAMEDRRLDQLAAVQVDQLRQLMAMRTEIDVNAWREKTTAFMAGEANEIDWTPFAGLMRSGRPAARDDQPDTPGPLGRAGQAGGTPGTPIQVDGAPTGEVTEKLLMVLTRLETKIDGMTDKRAAGSGDGNAVGRKRHRAQTLLDELGGGGQNDDTEMAEMEGEEPSPNPKKAKLDIMTCVRQYYDGTSPLTDRQHLVRLELAKLPLTSIAAFFGALRRVASTIESGEGEYRKFNETMTHTEAMVLDLFTEAMGPQLSLSARTRDALEAKFVTLLKAKMLSSEKFNFVKAAADAQQLIMKDLKEVGRDEHRDRDRDRRPGGDRRPGPPKGGVTCFECGKKGHKGFECKADKGTRKAYKESRRNG